MASERKEQAIYNAASEAVMELRVSLSIRQRDRLGEPTYDQLDSMLARVQHRAGDAAANAYRNPLLRKSEVPSGG